MDKNLLPQIHLTKDNSNNDNSLQLSPITVNEEYCKKWNEGLHDFVCLSKNGELLRPTLYRIGGINYPNLKKDNYFKLLKYVEAFYSEDILKMSGTKDPKHLEGRWCIIDKNGVEKVELPPFKYAYLVDESCIYSTDGDYYNIETGEHYCNTSTSMASNDFLFLENRFDKDESKRGVMKINKKDGSWELFPSKH
jgi:hypothetical protein